MPELGGWSLQAGFRVKKIVRSRGQHERKWQSAGRLGSGSDPFHGKRKFIKRLTGIPACILNCASHNPGLSSNANGFRDDLRPVAKSISQIRRDRHIGRVNNRFPMAEGFAPSERVVLASDDAGRGSA